MLKPRSPSHKWCLYMFVLHSSMPSSTSFTSPLPAWGAHSAWGWASKVRGWSSLDPISPLSFQDCHLWILTGACLEMSAWYRLLVWWKVCKKQHVVRLPPLRFFSFSWDCNKQVWIICYTMSGVFFNRIWQKKESKRYLFFTVRRRVYHDSDDYLRSFILTPGTKLHTASVACQDDGHQSWRALRSHGKVGDNVSWWGDAHHALQVTERLPIHP